MIFDNFFFFNLLQSNILSIDVHVCRICFCISSKVRSKQSKFYLYLLNFKHSRWKYMHRNCYHKNILPLYFSGQLKSALHVPLDRQTKRSEPSWLCLSAQVIWIPLDIPIASHSRTCSIENPSPLGTPQSILKCKFGLIQKIALF